MTTTMKPTRRSTITVRQAFAGVPLAAQAVIDSPIGPLLALATGQGLAGLWFDAQKHHPGELDAPVDASHPHIVATQRWLDAYWCGRDPSPAAVALDLHGTPFQRAVWRALLRIPLGRTKTYGEIAAEVAKSGLGAVPRATGTAVGRNPVSILVPCHRVIGANGSLTGYAGGLPRKEHLLQHEGVLLT
ncbi:MAG TPA: methylated-DNA--[protein]-cysteine S-methyltransferase [Burkholderiaceae bacterium]|nr:methylated-DNA--[protein]-cysteine S-methyltransferase [Burkholderiaceae bacterium]